MEQPRFGYKAFWAMKPFRTDSSHRATACTTWFHFRPLWTYPTPKPLRVKRKLKIFAAVVPRLGSPQFLVVTEWYRPKELGLLRGFRSGGLRTKQVVRHEPAVGSRTVDRRACAARVRLLRRSPQSPTHHAAKSGCASAQAKSDSPVPARKPNPSRCGAHGWRLHARFPISPYPSLELQ